MNALINYRHNTVSIQSLETFLDIKGSCVNGQRDVYFVRALGEAPHMPETVQALDEKMSAGTAQGGPHYLRLPELPKLTSPEDTAFYAQAYDRWRSGGSIQLKTPYPNANFSPVLGRATDEVLVKYKSIKAGATETIAKNYAVKLWYWMDCLLKDVISQWSETSCVKIVADNVQKEQPYLFYYMLTLLGCDVLLLNTQADIEITPSLKSLSASLTLGAYGHSPIPAFSKPRPQAPPPTARTAKASRPVPTLRPAGVHKPAPAASQSQEKSFEELASLASSIVMIAVHDEKGEPVGTGSGIMIGRKGFILTNHHVVRGGHFFSVRIEDDEQVYPTDEVIKYNSNLDLAVIRIQRELTALPIYDGRKKLVRGQKVVAIGSPLGLFNSVSDGIISGFRQIDDVDMIQFTAPISHGSSGGAVLNMAGEIIGISTAGIDQGQNINLAVSYESIRLFAKGFY